MEAWFKCVGPAQLIRQVSSFVELVKDLFPNFQPRPQAASSHSSVLTNSAYSTVSASTSSSSASPSLERALVVRSSEASTSTMANIPIDPAPFVPHGFQIFEVEGRTGVSRAILPHRP